MGNHKLLMASRASRRPMPSAANESRSQCDGERTAQFNSHFSCRDTSNPAPPFFFSSFHPLCAYLFQRVPKEKFLSAVESLIRMSQACGITHSCVSAVLLQFAARQCQTAGMSIQKGEKGENRPPMGCWFWSPKQHTECQIGNILTLTAALAQI